MTELDEQLEELSSAEDFLSYFEIEYDASVVHVNRLHILQRYHDYLAKAEGTMPTSEQARRDVHFHLLTRAYQDFVESTALDERVFKVLKNAKGQGFVSIGDIDGVGQ